MLPLMFLVIPAVAAASSSASLKAIPKAIEVGVTPTLNIRCSLPDPSTLNLFSVTQIGISFLQGGKNQVLSSIDVFDGKIVNPSATMDSVTGELGMNKENYLNLRWQSPDLKVTGTYTCDIAALNKLGSPVQYHYAVNVTAVELTRAELELKVQQLKAQLDNVTGQNQLLVSQNKEHVEKIRVLEENLKGHKTCDDVDLPVGQYDITLFPDDGRGLIKVICDVHGPGDVWTEKERVWNWEIDAAGPKVQKLYIIAKVMKAKAFGFVIQYLKYGNGGSSGGKLEIFQRRSDGSVNFTRRYSEYDSGFGSLTDEFWLGLNHVWRIMRSVPGAKYKLRVDMVDHYNVSYTRMYPTFDLGPSSSYVLTASGYDDNGRGLSFSSGAEFSTFDHGPQTYCAVDNGGGWWYDNCAFANLNSKYGEAGVHGMKWYELPSSPDDPLRAAQMKFKKA